MTPITDRSGQFSSLKSFTLAGLAAPALWLGYRASTHDLGALPVKEAMLFCGLWAIRFLILTLALTPLQRIFRWSRLALVRRMVGLSAFFYAVAHLLLYTATLKFDLVAAATEIFQRYYLTIGFAALLGLSALAVTSTDGMVRRLGRLWRVLHRFVYAITVLGLLHFFMQSKIDVSEATMMAGLFILLMIYRIALRLGTTFGPATLAGLGIAAALTIAGVEIAWYAVWTGIDPWLVLKANLGLASPRPAVWVFAARMALAILSPAWKGRSLLSSSFRIARQS